MGRVTVHKGSNADLQNTIEKYERVLSTIAELTKDREMHDGEPYDMESDDAVETLHSCISMAREALGMPRDRETD